MADKKFKIAGSDIKQLVTTDIADMACMASDRITVAGKKIGYMYREKPDREEDSGWRFFAGDESQEFTDDPGNFAIYAVNTIANYDPEIIPLLESPAGSAFERRGFFSKKFVAVPFEAPEEEEE